ncbi:cytochrome c peroxidase [Maribacter vaceletii]|uniref:Cytochrome c peroxidase n=1 Tax=Maribacter vaceletii TaxID=1206816 RepID=A0A495DU82_9FLAO|nr:cytochrome c peroxidase [Maribacter vaceletii]RKR08053.1 cytochrome c peroxidase [Maribacter vaceletii]
MKKIFLGINVFTLICILGCSKGEDNYESIDLLEPIDPFAEPNLPESYFNYADIQLPSYYTADEFPSQFQFQAPSEYDNTPSDNLITNSGATLGRVLFYDEKLSANGTVSCASCHQAEHGFSDSNMFSEGFEGELTRRHSMSIVNARFYAQGKFFWDERAATLEEQVLMPFQDDVEMGLSLEELVSIVNEQIYYTPLFEDAFGDKTITSNRISKALAQFIRSLVSITSIYDEARSEVESPLDDFPAFTSQENEGKRLFYLPRTLTNGESGNCVGCHQTEAFIGPVPTFSGSTNNTFTTSNGLDATFTNDLGVNESTGNPNDIGKFKFPSLKNIGVRPPYMHDGRLATLEQVIEHYSSGIKNHSNLISPLVNSTGQVGRFNFTEKEKEALVAFLHTLTDNKMLTDEKYSNPFK